MFCKIYGDILKLAPKIKTCHNIRRLYQNHYEVLKLKRSCTSQEIKDAFIKLSKEHHPDVTNNKQSHAKFLQINEAYKVLSKPETRRNYDLGLTHIEGHPNPHARNYYTETYYDPTRRNPYSDPLFWANRDRSRDQFYRKQPYYGINGVPRLSNGTILMFCIFFSLIGIGIQYLAIKRSFTFHRDDLIKKSIQAQNTLNETRDAASSNGNAAQLELLKTKLLGKLPKETDNK